MSQGVGTPLPALLGGSWNRAGFIRACGFRGALLRGVLGGYENQVSHRNARETAYPLFRVQGNGSEMGLDWLQLPTDVSMTPKTMGF